MKRDDVIKKLQELDIQYVNDNIGSNPAALPNHFAEYLGYASILYDHYASYIKMYEVKESQVIAQENDARTQHNKGVDKRDEKMTVSEVQQRIDVRLGELKGERKRLELAVKGATLHINGCQSLMKNWSDEVKGLR